MGFGEWRQWVKEGFGQGSESPDHFRVRPLALSIQKEELSKLMPQSAFVAAQTPHIEVAERRCHYEHAVDKDVHQDRQLSNQNTDEGHCQQAMVNRTAQPQIRPANGSGAGNPAWRKQYDRNLNNIQDHIYAVAGAVATLDSIEHKILEMKFELQRIRDNDCHVDCDKVILALQLLSEYVTNATDKVDGQCLNLLKDAKMEVSFAELNGAAKSIASGNKSSNVSLTMISINKLLDAKVKNALANGLVEDELPQFIQEVCAIISSNIQILTSVMLALFATRDYTQAVTKYAVRENIIPTSTNGTKAPLPRSRVQHAQLRNIEPDINAARHQLKEGRTSLTELLKHVREHGNDESALNSNT